MAVFLGPRQMMAVERLFSRKARDMAWREPMGVGLGVGGGVGVESVAGCELPFVVVGGGAVSIAGERVAASVEVAAAVGRGYVGGGAGARV
jgi:hypothetical protein